MSDFNDRYNRAAAMRLNTMPGMVPGAMAPTAQPYGPAPASYGKSWADLLAPFFGNKPSPRPSSMEGSPVLRPQPSQWMGEGDTQRPMPSMPQMEPVPVMPQRASTWQGEGDTVPPPMQRPPQPAPGNAGPPTGANAAFQPPPGWMPPADYMRTQNDADLGGYGGNPGRGRPFGGIPQVGPYDHLNPTPSLASSYAQQYAANPQGFDNSFLKRLFGG
jgi:hypothetical protein